MRKVKLLIALLALVASITSAIAFNTATSKPELYYYNSDQACVAAPCETLDQTGTPCLVTVYTDPNCQTPFVGTVWTSAGE